MTFTLTVDMDNAAFTSGETFDDAKHQARVDAFAARTEAARILRNTARILEEFPDTEGRVVDYNGNRVGEWKVTR